MRLCRPGPLLGLPVALIPPASRCPPVPPTTPAAGLPEEVSHSKQCLARGYAVLALMSKDRRYRFRCFSSSGDKTLSECAVGRRAVAAQAPARRSGACSAAG